MLKVATPTDPVDHPALLEMCENMTGQFIDVDLEGFDTGVAFQDGTSPRCV